MALDEFALDLLTSMGNITEAQAEQARSTALEKGKSVVTCLEEMGVTSEDEVLGLVAMELGMETFDLADYRIPDEIIKSMSSDIARRYKVVPVLKHETNLTVALADPTNVETMDALRYILHCDIDGVICKRSQVEKALDRYYGTDDQKMQRMMEDVTSGEVDVSALTPGQDERKKAEVEDQDAPIIKLVSLVIVEAYRTRASDIHLEPMEKRFRIRYRVDGILHEVEPPPKYLQNNVLQRLKIMARMDISEKRVPQDGRIMFSFPGKKLDLRVSSVPTVHGESIVMRILDKSSIQLGIPELGFFADDQALIKRILAMPDGIFLVTGPTGSGKTTSLYAFLNTLNTPNRKIITAEDPVEYELSGINQVQCDNTIGMTFARALRAMLRQAPNIIMVGEIRDIETGAIAINAALTGHLVFSTLHTNDAPTAVTRLIDMGVKPFLVASGLRAVMAQRLLRRTCKNCAVRVEPGEDELKALDLDRAFFAEAELKVGSGCPECKNGYKGRIGIYEIFMVEDSIVQLILKTSPTDVIRRRAIELGMHNLREDGLRKAAAGLTTLAEVIRITKSDDQEDAPAPPVPQPQTTEAQ